MIAIEKAARACVVLGLAASSCASAGVLHIDLRIAEPIRPLETLAAEKTLLGVSGVLTVKVNLQGGILLVTPVEGSSIDPATLPQAIKDTGVAVTHVGVTASGTLKANGETTTLEMEGPPTRISLSGGAKIEELTGNPALTGKTLRVSGTYAPGSRGNPPTLTVEEWAVPPPPAEEQVPDPAGP